MRAMRFLETPARRRFVNRGPRFMLWLLTGFILISGLAASQPGWAQGVEPFFWAQGEPWSDRRQTSLFKVETATKKVIASLNLRKNGLPGLTGLSLSSDRSVLFGTDSINVFVFDADRLSLLDKFRVRSEEFPWGGALFVHPDSGLLYLIRVSGSSPREVAIADPRLRKVVKVLKLKYGIMNGRAAYDPARDRLYVSTAVPAIIDLRTQRVAGYIPGLTFHDPVFGLLMRKDGRLILNMEINQPGSIRPSLCVYDPERETVVRQSVPFPPEIRLLRGLALSRDGARIFAATCPYGAPGTGVMVDAQTLTLLSTLTFPEPVNDFVLAPDGRGMWITTTNEVLRIDDKTGQVVESVSLPFRAYKIITPP